mgnify:CR=1 FL=1
MAGDDDLSALLPHLPLPAPARRDAAIDAALRRFDDGEAQPAAAPEPRRPWFTRPIGGALAAASLAALIAVPLVWMNNADPPAQMAEAGKAAPPEAAAPTAPAPANDAGPSYADARAPGGVSAAPDNPAPPDIRAEPAAQPRSARRSEAQRARGNVELAQADIPGAESSIVVTGSRIRRQDLSTMSPVTTIGSEELIDTSGAAAATVRGDWNACTVDDPARDPTACRNATGPDPTGARHRAGAHIADGLMHAWRGEQADAIEAFDRAIATHRRSASAFLNRGLVRQARGDLDRALDDLNRSIRYDLRAARGYYHRSRLLRQRGDLARARADMARAVQLDPGYAFLSLPSLPER